MLKTLTSENRHIVKSPCEAGKEMGRQKKINMTIQCHFGPRTIDTMNRYEKEKELGIIHPDSGFYSVNKVTGDK